MFFHLKNTLTNLGRRLVGGYAGHSSEWILVENKKGSKNNVPWKEFVSDEFIEMEDAPIDDILDVISQNLYGKNYVRQKRINNKKVKRNRHKKMYRKAPRVGHSSTTPTVVKGFDYLFISFIFFYAYFVHRIAPVFSDALAVVEPADRTAISLDVFGGIYFELHHFYCVVIIASVLYAISRYLLTIMWWFFEKLVLFRRYRRIVGNNVFSSQKCTNENFELVLKIIMCTNWRNPVQAASGLAAVVQIFRPSAVLLPEIQKIISRITAAKLYDGQSESIHRCVRELSVYVGHADDEERKESRTNRASRYWNQLITSDVGRGFSQLSIILVTTGFLPEIDWTVSGIEFFSLKGANETIKAKDVYTALQLIITSVVDGVACYEATGKLEGFFAANSLESKVSHALSLYQQVLIGNLSSYSEHTNETYIALLEDLKTKVERRMRNPKSSDKFFYKSYLDKLNDTLSSMAAIQMEQQQQEQAFGIMLWGHSSVGKSWFAPQMIEWLLKSNGYPHAAANIITYNTNSKYDDQVRNNTYGILLDDLANGKVGKGGADVRRTSDLVIALINSVAQPAVKADLAEKGRVLMRPRIVIATTNNRGCNAEFESHNEASVRRRFKFEVEVVVKEEYRLGGDSTEIDSEKVKEAFPGCAFPNAWRLYVSKCFIIDKAKSSGRGFEMRAVKSKTGEDYMEMQEFLEFFKAESAKHFKSEREGLNTRKNAGAQICEECEMPGNYHLESCSCARNGHSFTDDVYDALFTDNGILNMLSPEEVTEMENAQRLMDQNPEVANMLRTQSSWRNWMIFSAMPRWVLRIWIWTGGNLKKFIVVVLGMLLVVPYLLALLPGGLPKILSIVWVILAIWFVKDMSVHAIVETIIANSAERSARQAWRTVTNKAARVTLLKRMAILGSGLFFLTYLMKMSSLTFNGHSIEAESVEEAEEKMSEKGVWSFFRGLTGNSAGGITVNMTTRNLINRVSPNIVHISSDVGDKRKMVDGFFVCKSYLVVPKHFVNQLEDESVWEISRPNGRTEKCMVDLRDHEGERQWVEFGLDFVMVRLTGVNFAKDIVECFPKRANEAGYSAAKMLYRNKDHQIQEISVIGLQRKKFSYSVGKQTGIKGDGYIGVADSQPKNGMCCSLLVSVMNKPEIVGCHIAGKDSNNEECSQLITQGDLLKAISELDRVCAFKHIVQDEAYEAHVETCTSRNVHPYCATNSVNNELALDVLGTVGGTGPRKMFTKKTPYHEEVCKEWRIEDPYGIPKSTAKKVGDEIFSPWYNAIEEFCQAKNLIPYTYLARARKEIVVEMCKNLDQYLQAGGIGRPLTIDEAVNGIPGKRGIDGQKMNTAAGLRYGKTKAKHLKKDTWPYEYNDYVVKDVIELHSTLSKMVRAKNALNSNLKDEALKKKKVDEYRTRVFFSDELHYMIIVSQLFGPVMAFMMQHPKSAHSAIGLNAESHDWEQVWDYLLRKGEAIEASKDKGVAFDFKAFDKTLPENLMKMAWQVMIEIAKKMPGYTDQDIAKMRVIADEKTTPFIWFNGTLIQCNFTHTSGNGCTAPVGSIAGLMLLCMSFYKLEDPDGIKMLKALDFIRSIHLGDDGASTVIRTEEHNFNFLTLQKVLSNWGITITPPDKESIPTEYQDLSLEDFLQRLFYFCRKRDSIVGQLDEKSLLKSLLYYLPSKVEVEEVQLGQAMSSVLKEASLHEEKIFNKFHKFIKEMSEKYDIPVTHLDKTYDEYVIDWACDSGKRHIEYRNRDKPYIENLAHQGLIPESKQMKIFGKVIKEIAEEEEEIGEYVGHTGDVEIERFEVSVVCCKGSSCCRRPRRNGEGDASVLASSKSGLQGEANISDVVEINGEVDSPIKSTDTPSASSVRATSRIRFHICTIMVVCVFGNVLMEALGKTEFGSQPKWRGLTENKETLMFKFNDQGWTHGVSTVEEASMHAASHSGMQLGDFLSRPVKIGQAIWSAGDELEPTEINPWDEFLNNPTVARKIANYKLLRGNLHVKMVINGSPFLYGKMMCVYHPLYGRDDFTPANSASRLCRLSQRQHVYLNPTTSSGGELVLPFFWQYNAINIPTHEWDQLGNITMSPIASLKHAAGETASCVITFFAWMENVSLMQPTSSTNNFTGQSGEAEKKVVSKTATAVGKVAGALSTVPVIGPYARATEEVANRVGRLADIFGFSKPRGTYDVNDERIRHLGTLATTNDKDMARPLTLDIKNENTIDPRTVGLTGTDEMSIPHVCSKEALVTRFTWSTNDLPDKELFRIPITPYIRSTFPADSLVDLPPCAYVASLFQYWRGTMQYRFMVNASNFHRGKLRFRYEPYGTETGQDYNVVQSEILDLAEVHDHKCEIGWGADRNFLKVTDGSVMPAVPGESPLLSIHNGVLVVSVANSLTVPDATSENSIEIIVGINACEDIQFSVPTEKVISSMSVIADVTPTNPPPNPSILVYPQPTKIFSNTRSGMFYYGWHTNNFHDNQGYLRDKLETSGGLANKQYPAVPGIIAGEYDDTSRSVVRAQFDTMLKAGITYCLCSWWGPGTREDVQFSTAALVEAGTVAAGTMELGILYETTKIKQNGAFVANTTALNLLQSDMEYLKTNYCNSSKFLKRDMKDGSYTNCPVIFLYLLRGYSDSDKALILQRIINVFQDNAVGGYTAYPYIIGDLMFGTPRAFGGSVTSRLGALGAYDTYGQGAKGAITDEDVKNLHRDYRQWQLLNPAVHCNPTIGPGYNDRGVRLEADHPALARALNGYDEGSLYKSHLDSLEGISIQSDGNWFCTNSWNEWHEDSQVEPCGGAAETTHPTELTGGFPYEPYGTKYVNIMGNYMVSGYVAQSGEEDIVPKEDTVSYLSIFTDQIKNIFYRSEKDEYTGHSGEERENEHAPETEPTVTLLEKPQTYHHDDAVFFGETVGSLRALLKRYTKYAVVETTTNQIDSYHFPTFPFYNWDKPDISLRETLLTRIAVLFLGKRGSTRWKAIPDFRNSTPRISAVRLTDTAEYKIDTAISSDDIIGYGWNGADAVTGVYNPVLEWEAPYYSNARFHISRSLARTDERGHIHSYDGSAVFRNHYMCAAGDDFQLFYFLGTPSVSFA